LFGCSSVRTHLAESHLLFLLVQTTAPANTQSRMQFTLIGVASSSDSTHHRLVSRLFTGPRTLSEWSVQGGETNDERRWAESSGAANPSHIYRGKKEVTMRGLCVCVNGPL
jgi:hypothetical protein